MNTTEQIINLTNEMANNDITCIGGCGSGLGFFVVAGIVGLGVILAVGIYHLTAMIHK